MKTVLKTMKSSIFICLSVICLLFSCQNRKIERKENVDIDTYELSNTTKIIDTLQSLSLNLDFGSKTIIQYKIEDVDWGKVDFNRGCQLNVTSSYLKERTVFKVGLTALNIPLKFILQKKRNVIIFRSLQQFNTVYEDEFIFKYDKNKSEWILDGASSIIYTNQGKNIKCPYIFDTKQTEIIDVREMKTGECIEEKR